MEILKLREIFEQEENEAMERLRKAITDNDIEIGIKALADSIDAHCALLAFGGDQDSTDDNG